MDPITVYLCALALGLGVFLALWPLGLILGDVSVADAWWGPGVLAGLLLTLWIGETGSGARAALLVLLIGVWAARLCFVMLRRRIRHGEEDRRYREIRHAWGESFWWKSLFIVFALQGALQWLIAIAPLAGALAPDAPIGAVGALGALLAALGLGLEAVSDAQLDRFKRQAGPDALLVTGLRAHIRHPSYAGEMAFWWGIWLIAAEASAWWAIISPLLVTLLLTKVSGAPMTGASLKATKPEYAAWAARTPAFIPRLR
ncbi:DUF1295 domain-containing protein [Pikeienuella piscinae]|uniref:DUF1295 domain-containing protein n=1 Tax=Pikeienuella piscinae TaxID=2748098 RepID=A0A7L5BXA2_9RHOB|nr:DUF1295 domain-containing protein [Pikeienuella piscinae]QIE54876.1 DUF1295 domain-containing protein [Pikeienuella piscinae]